MMSRVSGACMSMLALSAIAAGAAHAQVADRYGPTAPSYDAPADAAGRDVLAGAPVRMLSWPGKVTQASIVATTDLPGEASRQARTVSSLRFSALPERQRQERSQGQMASASVAPPTVYRTAQYVAPAAPAAASPRYGLVQAYPQTSGPTASAGASSAPSIYDDAPVRSAAHLQAAAPTANPGAVRGAAHQPTPVQTAAASDALHPGWAPPRRPWSQAGDQGVRFYSLHRQYGVTPDPAPIPPQFFAATADLGDPAGPTPRTVSGAGTAAQAARAVQASESDTASSQP